MNSSPRKKVAILGGGVGAMTAAYYLTSTEDLRAQYEVTVYQQGWRIGGKGAAGRDRSRGDRILEHGLHIWLGFYDNAFATIRACYEDWQKNPKSPFQTWDQVFQPQWRVTLLQNVEPSDAGPGWRPRSFVMPELPGFPGEPRGSDGSIDLLGSVHSMVKWLQKLLEDSAFSAELAATTHPGNLLSGWFSRLESDLVRDLQHVEGRVEGIVGHWALHAARKFLDRLLAAPTPPTPPHHEFLDWLLGEFQAWLHSPVIRGIARSDDTVLFLWQGLDYITANARGIVRDILPWGEAGFDRINGSNYLDWLREQGIAEESVWCAASRVVFDLAFAYPGGLATRDNARMAAGVALGVCLRMFLGYRHAPLWRMLPGMGDAIFAPIHEVLARQRGVRFEFFHRVRTLKLSDDGTRIEAMAVDRQATLLGDSYQPLFESVQGFPSWPSEPFWEQLKDGEKLREAGVDFESAWCDVRVEERLLEWGKDFDLVVLGISVAGLKSICGDLYQRLPAWTAMLDNSATVETQAMQLWMNRDTASLGWKEGSTIMSCYAEPFDSWGEMSPLLPYENWPAPGPLSLQYFCGALPCPAEPPLHDPNYPAEKKAQVRLNAIDWLERHAAVLWPAAADLPDRDGLDFECLYDSAANRGVARFDFQYWRSNIDPSERYVLSLPGSIQHRLRAENSGVANLFLAGDWLVSSVNAGCVEAAVESGMAAARAICGVPREIQNYPPAPPVPRSAADAPPGSGTA